MVNKIYPKAGIYFSHQECFGHTSRVMAVGEVFKKGSRKGIFFVQAGVQQPRAKLDELGKIYPLPGKLMDRRHFRGTFQGTGADTGERTQACLDIMIREKPDLLITEFFPLGWEQCRHELIAPLVKASQQGALLWAVAGYPLLTGTSNEWRRKIFKLYQQIIIFSPSLEKERIADSFAGKRDKQNYLDFFKQHAKKIIFAGYLLPRQKVVRADKDENLSQPSIPKGACRVAVLRGGGAYFPKVIAQAIRASDLLGEEYHLSVVAGPSTTPREWKLFSTLVGKKKINNLVLFKSVNDYEGLIKNSDVCVSVASYHTAVMLLKHRKRAVLIPFEGHGVMSNHEQPARAAMLKEKIGARILSIHDLTAKALAAAIKEAAVCKANNAHIPKEWFMGADVLDKALTGLFSR